MFGIKKELVDHIIWVIVAIFISYSLPGLPYVGYYIKNHQWVIFIVALLLIFLRKKIVDFIGG